VNAVAGVVMVAGIPLLVSIVILLRWPESSYTPSQPKTVKNRTSDISTELYMNDQNDQPPAQSYYHTENSSEIGMYRGNPGCNNRNATTDIKFYDDIFVNRDKQMKTLTEFLLQHQHYIAVISGHSGFGKSRLAVQWGVKVVENGTDVRYVDLSHSNPHSIQMPTSDKDRSSLVSPSLNSGVQSILNNFPGSNTNGHNKFKIFNRNIMAELLEWSKAIRCPTVLILDNTYDIIFNNINRSDLMNNLKRMITNHGNRNLHIVVTSQYKLSTTTIHIREHVYNLSLDSSLELINKSLSNVTSIDENDAAEIAELVGGCPLALKIVASLLRLNNTDSATLKQELQAHPIEPLSTSDDQAEQLEYIFGISFKHLEELNFHNCTYYVSLFPGSFSEVAGKAILPRISSQGYYNSCHKTLFDYSLLEKYWAGKQSRFEMHRLLRQYARKQGHSEFHELQKQFNETFAKYFVALLKDHARFLKEGNHAFHIWEEHQFNHSLENLNIQHLLQILLLKDKHSLEELQVLAFAACKQDISFSQLERHYHEFVNQIKEVCDMLNKQDCENLYKDVILHTLQNTCKSFTLSDHIRSAFMPCSGLFDCNTLQTLHKNRNIWIRLTGEGQIYLRHLEISYCKPWPFQFLSFHFPWPALLLIASAELAIMPTLISNPPITVKVIFIFTSILSILDIGCSCYNILWHYPDQDDVIESCIAYIAEIGIYLTCFIIFVPRIFMPNSKIYNEDNLVKRSNIFNFFLVIVIYIAVHYAFTSFPNALSYVL
jgi:hypothetical protein